MVRSDDGCTCDISFIQRATKRNVLCQPVYILRVLLSPCPRGKNLKASLRLAKLVAKVRHVDRNSHSKGWYTAAKMGEEVIVSVDAVDKRVNAATQKPASQPAPSFKSLSQKTLRTRSKQVRKIRVPPNRMSPLKSRWMEIYEPIVKYLKLQIRMNLRTKCVELKTGKATEDTGALQKGADFVKAFVLGFAVADAIALIRLDDLYIETFEVRDIRATLKGDHLSRAVGRIAGKDGRTKFTIENATKTRIVVADTKIHILGSYENTRLARHSISSLVLGAAPGKVYNKLRTVSARLNERNF